MIRTQIPPMVFPHFWWMMMVCQIPTVRCRIGPRLYPLATWMMLYDMKEETEREGKGNHFHLVPTHASSDSEEEKDDWTGLCKKK